MRTLTLPPSHFLKAPWKEFYVRRRPQRFEAYSHKGLIQGLANNICKDIPLQQGR
ncbi:14618_t:CDS:2 [Funneliformis caledonium]|uniref:14618_t:CDS:1 n=1 Tax=Funneliformis caledonium TaxID=1117310 RepID=A0A9N9C4C1_9GLOM|nr:14618_t:CDS:2 [Funneliformis caledonium]